MSNEIKKIPTAGYRYKVVSGDRITRIANRAYGTQEKASLIVDANPYIKGRPISLENLPTIYPNDILTIPEIIEKGTDISGKEPYEFTLRLEDIEIPVESATLLRTMDTASDACNCTIAWNPGIDKKIDEVTAPYSFSRAKIFLGNTLMLTGRLYNVTPKKDTSGITKELEIFSNTIDIVDSTVSPPYEKNNTTLFERAQQLCNPLGIEVETDLDSDGGAFKRMTADKTETIFEHLLKYARQKSILISSTPTGKLLFTRANTTGESVGSITLEIPITDEYSAEFNGREIFNMYRAIGQNARKFTKKQSIAIDNNVPRSRQLTFDANDSTEGNIQDTAEWRRSKQYTNALTIPVPIKRSKNYGWLTPNGSLWRENTIMTLISDILSIPDGFNLLVRSVEYTHNADGNGINLSVIPPQTYSGEIVETPWSVS